MLSLVSLKDFFMAIFRRYSFNSHNSAALCVLTPPSALSPLLYLLARVQHACRETWRTNGSLLLLAQEAPRLADRERELGERFVAVELVYQAAELVNLWVALRH
mmetsp:Transcript_30808/g.49726  ORF Transcript_30808/g.49726 Transcript_30808/m.49726 type:complete len:104 (+) Transcript_30808:122-433(+)